MGRKLGAVSLRGLGFRLTRRARAEVYLRPKFRIDPSNCLATIHQRYRQADGRYYPQHENVLLVRVIGLFGRPFVKRFALCYQTVVCLSCLNVGVLWPKGGWIKMKLGVHVGLGPGHIVLDGYPAPFSKRGHSPHFWPIVIVAKPLNG